LIVEQTYYFQYDKMCNMIINWSKILACMHPTTLQKNYK